MLPACSRGRCDSPLTTSPVGTSSAGRVRRVPWRGTCPGVDGIGAAFPHKEGPGFNIELKSIPLDGRIVLLPPDETGWLGWVRKNLFGSIGNSITTVVLLILIVWGDSDPVIPAEHGRNAHRIVEHSRYVEIEGSGHWTQQENPAEFNEALLGFLRSL